VDLDAAIVNLANREGTGIIGFIDVGRPGNRGRDLQAVAQIHGWLVEKDLPEVIWTDLKPNFEEKVGRPFTVESAMSYLLQLEGETRAAAWEYLERAPIAIQTPLRRRLVQDGWIVPISD
jgi:hypothetical protein